jgi:hypothetical protein
MITCYQFFVLENFTHWNIFPRARQFRYKYRYFDIRYLSDTEKKYRNIGLKKFRNIVYRITNFHSDTVSNKGKSIGPKVSTIKESSRTRALADYTGQKSLPHWPLMMLTPSRISKKPAHPPSGLNNFFPYFNGQHGTVLNNGKILFFHWASKSAK